MGGRVLPSSANSWDDVTQAAGIDFKHVNGALEQYHFIETYGSGVAFFDYDTDGYADLYLVNSGGVPGTASAVSAPNQLFKNTGKATFTDQTLVSASGDLGYGMGVAAGDYNNDGYPDLYVTNWGENRLLRNQGNGTFSDQTKISNTGDSQLGMSAAFADIDLDGDLDLYVANYAHFNPNTQKECFHGGIRVYCGPLHHEGIAGVLYRNKGDGRFDDITRQFGLDNSSGRQLGVVFADYDLDGDPDLYVANDAVANFLFRNDRTRFIETGLLAGVAYNQQGEPEAGMGTDWADFDRDGDPDLIVTNYQWESNRLYRNEGQGYFLDATDHQGLAATTLPYLGFGVNFFDYNNDGWLDLFTANGHVDANVSAYDRAVTYAQKPLLFTNTGSGFQANESVFSEVMVGRGSATADYDLDGDLDLCITTNGQKASLWRNQNASEGSWLEMKMQGIRSNRSAIGARIVIVVGEHQQTAVVKSGSSYLSQSQLTIHFGLGRAQQVDRLTIYWPSGIVQILEDIVVNQRLNVTETIEE